jgi:hypothetical protein
MLKRYIWKNKLTKMKISLKIKKWKFMNRHLLKYYLIKHKLAPHLPQKTLNKIRIIQIILIYLKIKNI